MYAHGSFHETPDHERYDEQHAKSVNTRRSLEKEIVDHEQILEKNKIALNAILAFVGP